MTLLHRAGSSFRPLFDMPVAWVDRYQPFVEKQVAKQLLEASAPDVLSLVGDHWPTQEWIEKVEGEDMPRRLFVHFLREEGRFPWPRTWTRRHTNLVCEAIEASDEVKDKQAAHLFIVIGAAVQDFGRKNVYVSGPVLNLPKEVDAECLSRRGWSLANLLEERHTLRHQNPVPVAIPDTFCGGCHIRLAGT